jgi:carboxyl-terminal processing protease
MNRQFGTKTVIALMLLASALTCVILFAAAWLSIGRGADLIGEIRTYFELRRSIEEVYIGDYDAKDVSQAALAAVVESLGDPWSYYLNPEEYQEYINSSNNQYAGIGISVIEDEATGGIRIKMVYPGSAAEQSGLKAGDVIMTVNGTDVTQMEFYDATNLIEGEIGDTVTLKVLNSEGQTSDVDVVYALIDTNPVSYELLDGGIGYIAIEDFESSAADVFIAAADDLIRQGAKSFIFDVRNDGGGRVSELKRMLDYLLPEGEIFIAINKNGEESISESDASCIDMPAVVLVNNYSFSAAEYFAAVLGEYDYATVVGQQTTGKNRSQVTIELPDGGALHISSGEYVTPNRVSLFDQGGLTPDVEITMTDEQYGLLYNDQLEKQDDLQLQKAIELLKQA